MCVCLCVRVLFVPPVCGRRLPGRPRGDALRDRSNPLISTWAPSGHTAAAAQFCDVPVALPFQLLSAASGDTPDLDPFGAPAISMARTMQTARLGHPEWKKYKGAKVAKVFPLHRKSPFAGKVRIWRVVAAPPLPSLLRLACRPRPICHGGPGLCMPRRPMQQCHAPRPAHCPAQVTTVDTKGTDDKPFEVCARRWLSAARRAAPIYRPGPSLPLRLHAPDRGPLRAGSETAPPPPATRRRSNMRTAIQSGCRTQS